MTGRSSLASDSPAELDRIPADGPVCGGRHPFPFVPEQVQRLRSAGVGDDALGLRLTPSDPRQPAPDMLEDDVVDDEDDGRYELRT